MTSGIYEIRSIASNKCYVGSSKNIGSRWYQHRRDLNRGSHTSPRLQQAWIKHGEQNFVFAVLEECDAEVLFRREQYHIDLLKPDYNSMLQVRVISKEMRAKMNAALAANAAARTHCPHGHEYTADNSYLSKKDGSRICRACNRDRVAKIYAAETPEQTAERLRRGREYHERNYDDRRAKQNAYAARTREQKHAYDAGHRPEKNARRKAHYAANRETETAKKMAWYYANHALALANAKERRNRERDRELQRAYQIAYRPIKNAKRRAKAAEERTLKAPLCQTGLGQ